MPRGGYRPGAGRKSNAERERLRARMDQAVPPEDWLAIYRRLARDAQSDRDGNNVAARLLIEARIGLLARAPANQQTEEPIKPIVFIDTVVGVGSKRLPPRPTPPDPSEPPPGSNDPVDPSAS